MGKADTSTKPVTQIAEELYLAELTKAAQRIGETTDRGGEWLARFARTDLQALSTGGWTDLLYEIANLAEYQYRSATVHPLWHQAVTLKDWGGAWRYEEDEALNLKFLQIFSEALDHIGTLHIPSLPIPCELPPRSAVAALQQEVVAALTEIREHRQYQLTLPTAHIIFGVLQDTDDVVCIGILESPQVLFAYNLAFMLATNATRLRRCGECEKWFFADRKNKAYCSAQCQSKAGTRRYRVEIQRKKQALVKGKENAGTHAKPTKQGGRNHGTKR